MASYEAHLVDQPGGPSRGRLGQVNFDGITIEGARRMAAFYFDVPLERVGLKPNGGKA